MATLAENLATIQSGIFGKDVRQAIYEGIQQASESGGSGEDTPSGPSIDSVSIRYLRTSSTTTPTLTNTGWQTTLPTLTSSYLYLWVSFRLTMSDETTKDTPPVLVGTYNWRPTAISIYYARTTSSTSPSITASTWTTTKNEPTAAAPYLHAQFRISYANYQSTSTHTVNSPGFLLRQYQEPTSSSSSGIVVNITDVADLNDPTKGDEVLASIQSGIMPVVYDGTRYCQTVCVTTRDNCGIHYLVLGFMVPGCSSLIESTVEMRCS